MEKIRHRQELPAGVFLYKKTQAGRTPKIGGRQGVSQRVTHRAEGLTYIEEVFFIL